MLQRAIDGFERLDSVYVTYWSLKDPLCQSQVLPYLRGLTSNGYRVGLVTFEQARWTLQPSEARKERADLLEAGINWLPLRYHKRPPVVSTLFDIARGVVVVSGLGLVHRSRLIHGRASVGSAVACIASMLLRRPFFYDADGPLSEEFVDAGTWRAGSFPHLVTRWAERAMFRRASAVAVLTTHRAREVAPLTEKMIELLPCAVDTEHFVFDRTQRDRLRVELQLEGLVLVYAGKWGGWYLSEELVRFARAAQDRLGSTLLVLTVTDKERFEHALNKAGVRHRIVGPLREQMPWYLSAADVGLSLIAEVPSKKACSPVKNAEYLACGLPIVSTRGAGDYVELIQDTSVGVIVDLKEDPHYGPTLDRLRELLTDVTLRDRCRATAETRLSVAGNLVPKYLSIYERLT